MLALVNGPRVDVGRVVAPWRETNVALVARNFHHDILGGAGCQ